ncbi:MAG: DNA-directed RNA polymerase subunit omega [Acidobacteriota bacterium]
MQPIPEKIDSKFRFVLLAAQRAEQLMRGGRSQLEDPARPEKPTHLAMEEVLQERLTWDYGPRPTPDPELLREAAATGDDEASTEIAAEEPAADGDAPAPEAAADGDA